VTGCPGLVIVPGMLAGICPEISVQVQILISDYSSFSTMTGGLA